MSMIGVKKRHWTCVDEIFLSGNRILILESDLGFSPNFHWSREEWGKIGDNRENMMWKLPTTDGQEIWIGNPVSTSGEILDSMTLKTHLQNEHPSVDINKVKWSSIRSGRNYTVLRLEYDPKDLVLKKLKDDLGSTDDV